MEQEDSLHKESEFDKLCESRKMDGWHFVAKEGLTKTKVGDDRIFREVPFQAEDSIREKYLEMAKREDPSSEFEVDLVLDENTYKLRRFREISTEEEYRNALDNLREADRVYYVFVRRVAK